MSVFDELRGLGAERPALRLAHRADVPVPARLEDKLIMWNRDNSIEVTPVVVEDPVAALRTGEAEFAMISNSGPLVPDVETVVVRLTRLERIELLHLPEPSAEAAAFLTRV